MRLDWFQLCEAVDLNARGQVESLHRLVRMPRGFGVHPLPCTRTYWLAVWVAGEPGETGRLTCHVEDERGQLVGGCDGTLTIQPGGLAADTAVPVEVCFLSAGDYRVTIAFDGEVMDSALLPVDAEVVGACN